MLRACSFRRAFNLKSLIGLCRRLGMSLEAGIDLRSALQREAEAARRAAPPPFAGNPRCDKSRRNPERGAGRLRRFLSGRFSRNGEVGEQSGELDAVLNQLAEYDQARLNMRRTFLASIIWPLTQFGFALAVVGFLIWIMGVLGSGDLLGLGLIGNRGLAIYATFLAVAGTLLGSSAGRRAGDWSGLGRYSDWHCGCHYWENRCKLWPWPA